MIQQHHCISGVYLNLLFFSLVCYGAKDRLHTASPLPKTLWPCGNPDVLFFTFLSINHTVQCPRSKKWMPSALILLILILWPHVELQVWRVSATWTEAIWKRLESRFNPWKYVVLTGLYFVGNMWRWCLDIPSIPCFFSFYL